MHQCIIQSWLVPGSLGNGVKCGYDYDYYSYYVYEYFPGIPLINHHSKVYEFRLASCWTAIWNVIFYQVWSIVFASVNLHHDPVYLPR